LTARFARAGIPMRSHVRTTTAGGAADATQDSRHRRRYRDRLAGVVARRGGHERRPGWGRPSVRGRGHPVHSGHARLRECLLGFGALADEVPDRSPLLRPGKAGLRLLQVRSSIQSGQGFHGRRVLSRPGLVRGMRTRTRRLRHARRRGDHPGPPK
jgi:hypothetical protein